ncbi:MAG: response regulator [Bacteroidales bacterium]|nr:response regulator [Bacteroidales bacterium]
MRNRLIFFVDDDKMMLNLMEYTFKCRDGYDVKSYFSGEECIENLSLNPDLIVLDYYLGDLDTNSMSGMETLTKIIETNKDFNVIILSREKNPELIQEFKEKGAKEYVIKDDYFIDTLIDTIEHHFT